jgi:hypothetical protein
VVLQIGEGNDGPSSVTVCIKTTDQYRPTVRSTPFDDTPLETEGGDEFPSVRESRESKSRGYRIGREDARMPSTHM